MAKENDWFAANLGNPDFSPEDFKSIGGLSIDNTQFLSREEYKNKPKVKEIFTDENGKFDENKFNNFYNAQVQKWNEFIDESAIDTYERSIWDVDIVKEPKSKIKDPNIEFTRVPNPDRVSIGVAGRNVYGERVFSQSELAQQQKIFDFTTGKELDLSPNDENLFENPLKYFKSLFDDPLVMASWDQDGQHVDPVTGMLTDHHKGELKLNDNGTYYYETLGDRSLVGKQVLSAMDMISVDGTGINKYDFLDSDGLEKSTTGIIAKNIAAVAPILLPGAGKIYAGLFVAKEIAKALPMLYGMTALFGNNDINSTSLNYLAGLGAKFSSGVTEHSQQHVFTIENFGNLVSDVALQWGQQRLIVEAIGKLRGLDDPIKLAHSRALGMYGDKTNKLVHQMIQGEVAPQKIAQYTGMSTFSKEGIDELIKSGKWMDTPLGKACIEQFLPAAQKAAEKRARLGQDLALAYMAIISNTDVYDSALEHGATRTEAAALALGTTLMMFGVDKTGLGELFFDDAAVDAKQMRAAFRNRLKTDAADAVKFVKDSYVAEQGLNFALTSETKEINQNILKRFINKGLQLGKEYREGMQNHTLGFFGKALGEGIEETAEELVTDVGKSMFELAHQFGWTSQSDYGAWDNAAERYTMSFLGGAVGGGMFYGVDAFKNPKTYDQKKSLQSLEYFVANKKTGELLKQLDDLHKKGQLGSKELSIDLTDPDENGKRTFISASDKHLSQNDYVYNLLRSNILSLDQTLNEYGLNLTEDELFDQMVQKDVRLMELRDYLQDKSYLTGYQQQFRELTHNIWKTIQEREIAAKTIDGRYSEIIEPENLAPDGYKRNAEQQSRYDANMKAYNDKLTELIKERDAFKSGHYSPYYTSMTLWAMDTALSGPFLAMNLDQFARIVTGKAYANLSEAEQSKIKKNWEVYLKSGQLETDVRKSYDKFQTLSRSLDGEVSELSETDVKVWAEILKQIEKYSIESQNLTYDSRIIDTDNPDIVEFNESEESYNNRSTKLESETDEQFAMRVAQRQQQIQQYNERHALQYIQNLLNNVPFIDDATRRKISAQIGLRKQDIAGSIADNFVEVNKDNPKIDKEFLRKFAETIKKLKPDFSNRDEIIAELNELNKSTIESTIRSQLKGHVINSNLLTYVKQYVESQGIDAKEITRDDMFKFLDVAYEEFNNITKNKYALRSKESLDEFANFLQTPETEIYLEGIYGYGIDINDDLKANLAVWNKNNIIAARLDELNNIKDEDLTPELAEERDKLQEIWESDENYSFENDDQTINNIVERTVEETKDDFNKEIEKLLGSIEKDPQFKMWSDLDSRVKIDMNPNIRILNAIAKQLGEGFDDIEQTLKTIYDYYQQGITPDDFRLTTEQQEALEKARQLLAFGRTVISAASTNKRGTFKNPVGHNAVVNDFIKQHSDVAGDFQELPILSDELGNILIHDFDRYEQEINYWLERSNQNIANKNRKLQQTGIALVNAKIKLWQGFDPEYFKTKGRVDLLEGIDIQSAKTEKDLHDIQNKFYINVQKALKSESFEDVFAFIPKILDVNEAIRQQLSNIDEKFSVDRMTDYYKFTYIMSIAAIDSTTLINHIKQNIQDEEKLAPLATQEEMYRMAASQALNSEFINSALDLLNSYSTIKLPVLKNSTIVIGVGGAGKSRAGAKQYAKLFDNKVYLSGPTKNQIEQLKEIIEPGIEISVEDLLKSILGPSVYYKMESEIQNPESSYTTFRIISGLDSNRSVLINSDTTVSDVNQPVKALIFDEATHLPNAFIQVLTKWAEKNDIQILFMGDDLQNGANTVGENLSYEYTLGWRTPKLSISLRDANIQKINNLQQLIDPLQKARNSTEEEMNLMTSNLEKLFSELKFHAYTGTTFSGDAIVKTITPEIMSGMNVGNSMAFIGDVSSETYKQLIAAGFNPTVLNAKEIQGREFDYVIIDRNDWPFPNSDLSKDKTKLGKLFIFGKDLYTMISRSKLGTVIIDNGISDIIKSPTVFDKTTGTVPRLDVDGFKKIRLEQIDKLDLSPVKIDDEPTPSPGPKKKTKPHISIEDESEPEQDEPTIEKPILSYGSVTMLGVTQETRGDEKVWINNGSNRDLSIVMNYFPKEFGGKSELVSKEDKDKAVDLLLTLKSIFLFNKDGYYVDHYDSIPASFRSIIPLETLKSKVQYYIEVSNYDEKSDHLVGDTMDSKGLDIKNGKKFLVIAKWNDESGKECTLTLGALGNPQTWIDNIPAIKARLDDKIARGINVEENQKYRDQVEDLARSYDSQLTTWSENNQLIEIDPPQLTGFSDLKKNDGGSIRLQNISDDIEPFFRLDQHGIYSGLYGIWEELDIEPEDTDSDSKSIFGSVIGKSVMFASANKLLKPNELIKEYIAQKTDSIRMPQVRMIVLDNKGVSYQSLYDSDFTNLYKASNLTGNAFPFELIPMGVRMYTSLWNTRANIRQFKTALNQWMDNEHLDSDKVEELLRQDSNFYRECVTESGKTYVDEDTYHEWVRANKSDKFDEINKIWKFNDGLSESVRQFRLGYHPRTGAYVRKLTGIEDGNPFYTVDYKDAKKSGKQTVESYDKVMGIYINPKLLDSWEKSINILFEEVLDKVIDPNIDGLKNKQDSHINPYNPEGWYKVAKGGTGGKLTFGIDGKETTIEVENDQIFKIVPIALTIIGKSIGQYRDDYVKKLHIKINGQDEEIDWLKLTNAFDGGIKQNEEINSMDAYPDEKLTEGQFKVSYITTRSNAGPIEVFAVEDLRFENMMNFIFHGCSATKSQNDFDSIQLRASDAHFKYGFLVDPVYAKKGTKDPRECPDPFTPVHSSKKFFGSDVRIGMPQLYVSLRGKETGTKVEPESKKSKDTTEDTKIIKIKQDIEKLYGITGIREGITEAEIELMLKRSEQTMITNLFANSSDTKNKFENCIISHTIDDKGNVQVTYLKDLKGLPKEGIKDVTLNGGKIQLTLDGNISYVIEKQGTDFNITKVEGPKNNQTKINVADLLKLIKETKYKDLTGKEIYKSDDFEQNDDNEIVPVESTNPKGESFDKFWEENIKNKINLSELDSGNDSQLHDFINLINPVITYLDQECYIGTLKNGILEVSTIEPITFKDIKNSCSTFKP